MFHPGGRKVLEVCEQGLGRSSENFFSSYETLRRHGNMSSATVLFVLDHVLEHEEQAPGSYGILAAFGPGFSAELSLLKWVDSEAAQRGSAHLELMPPHWRCRFMKDGSAMHYNVLNDDDGLDPVTVLNLDLGRRRQI
ncbi:3-oxoacyl-[acyl-carrier-protein] synthase III C-terminal domain-containing protein [Bradyrhizobium sp. RDT10]